MIQWGGGGGTSVVTLGDQWVASAQEGRCSPCKNNKPKKQITWLDLISARPPHSLKVTRIK